MSRNEFENIEFSKEKKTTEINPSEVILRGISLSDETLLHTFGCGNNSMDTFLQIEAYWYHIKREGSTTLAFYEDNLIGYFTLRRDTLTLKIGQTTETRNALSLSRLAVDSKYQNRGFGKCIINKVVEMAYMTNERYIITDAIHEYYKWYENQGFKVLIPEEVGNDPCVFMAMDLSDEKLIGEYSEV